jgi:hypothetical protein
VLEEMPEQLGTTEERRFLRGCKQFWISHIQTWYGMTQDAGFVNNGNLLITIGDWILLIMEAAGRGEVDCSM